VFKMLLMSVRLPFFLAAMAFAGLANGLAFFVLARMRSLGRQVGIWRSHRDWALYRDYWRLAPENRWSRIPVAVGLLSFALALYFLWFSIWGVHVPR
jgi:hypothetical protein